MVRPTLNLKDKRQIKMLKYNIMNLNLVAPTGKCSDFNVSFKEPIEIEAGSSIQFNWAKFSRSNGIVLDRDAEFKIRPKRAIPSRLPATPATLTLNEATYETANKFIIPRGKYTAYELQNEIQTKVNNFLGASYGSAHPTTNGWNTQYYLENIRANQRDIEGDDLLFGMTYINNNTSIAMGGTFGAKLYPINADANNGANFHYRYEMLNGKRQFGYTKSANLGGRVANTYDNYMLSSEHLFHYGEVELEDILGGTEGTPIQDGLFADNGKWKHLSGFRAQTLKDIGQIQARTVSSGANENVVIGLYSREWAEDATVNAGTNKTVGTGNTTADGVTLNPHLHAPNTVEGNILAYMTIEIGENHDDANNGFYDNIMVRVANKGGNATDALKFMNPTDAIAGMTMVYETRLSDIVQDMGYIPEVFCHTYYKKNPNYNPTALSNDIDRDGTGYLDEDILFFRVGLIIEDEDTFQEELKIIYDSGVADVGSEAVGFSQVFFNHFENLANPHTQTAGQVNFQIPFNLIMSAQFPDDGWAGIEMSQLRKENIVYNYNTNPTCIIRGYQIVAPTWWGDMINPFDTKRVIGGEYYSKVLYPTPQSEIVWGAETANTPWNIYIEDMTTRFRNRDIAVYIESLPLNNYKNIGSDGSTATANSNKGYKKNLLAVCPTPFADSESIGGAMSGFYSPFNTFITKLKNQEFRTNNLRILIKDSSTDKPLNELENVVIDFTILK